MVKVLVIAAHMDDEVLGLGGTIAKHVKNDEVHVYILTESSSIQYKEDKKKQKKKYKECEKALKVLGIKHDVPNRKFSNPNFPEMGLFNIPIYEITEPLTELIDFVNPDIIYTHSPYDLNRDHRIVYEATMVATRFRPINIYGYFSDSHNLTQQPEPNVFVDITAQMNKKLKAFKCYKTEIRKFPHPRSIKFIKMEAERWGAKIGVKYAEPFSCIREVR